jgi:hypothetical protein
LNQSRIFRAIRDGVSTSTLGSPVSSLKNARKLNRCAEWANALPFDTTTDLPVFLRDVK